MKYSGNTRKNPEVAAGIRTANVYFRSFPYFTYYFQDFVPVETHAWQAIKYLESWKSK
jgi:hypothetical protein